MHGSGAGSCGCAVALVIFDIFTPQLERCGYVELSAFAFKRARVLLHLSSRGLNA